MELEENGLRRRIEELRHALSARTKELAQSQELYSKLKQRALLSQAQDVSSSVLESRTSVQADATIDASYRQPHTQPPRPGVPTAGRSGVSNYFPASPKYHSTQPGPTGLVEWDKPRLTQRKCFSQFNSWTVC